MTTWHYEPGTAPRPYCASDGPPTTPHQAYVHGLEASRRGDDLGAVVFTAMTTWSADARGCSELIACASLGWCADRWKGVEA